MSIESSPIPARERLRRAGRRAVERLRRPRRAETPPGERPRTQADAPRPRGRKAAIWTAATLGLLALVVALVIAFWDWNYMRGPIGRYASGKLGREVRIAGDLRVHLLSWSPSATADAILIGNPRWAGPGRTAEVGRLLVQIRLMPLFRGQTVFQRLEVYQPRVSLYRDAQGRATWDFSKGGPKGEPFRMPPVRRFVIEDGRLTVRDDVRKLRFQGTVNATERSGQAGRGFQMEGEGAINAAPFLMRIVGGPLLNIDPDKPYPFDTVVQAGSTRITAKGAIPKPFDFGRFNMNLSVQGQDLEDLYELIGVPLPNTPPYRLTGLLVRDERIYRVTGLAGRVGDSDMGGALSVDTSGERPFLRGDLRSRRLDFDDLAAIFGGSPSVAPGETASAGQKAVAANLNAQQRLLPDSTLKVDRIRAMDADVRYRAETINAPNLPLKAASVRVRLDHGLLTADPLAVDLPQGRIAGQIKLNARGATPVTDLDLRLSNARIEQLVPVRVGGGQPLHGALVGRARLRGEGNSVHRAFASADGEVVVVAPGGEIREAFAELLGVNVVKGLGLLLSKDQGTVPVNCAVAHFQARDGLLSADQIVFDTGPVLVTGKGGVNLDTERMAFRMQGHPKELRLVRVLAPITVAGPIAKPKLGVDPSKAIAQTGVAATLGALLTPLAAILPFVDPGLAKDANCGALLAQARRDGAPVAKAAP